MTIYRGVKKARQANRLDQDTWANQTLVGLSYNTSGAGTIETELIDFSLAFEGPPFFSYGVELQPESELVPDDFPMVTAGVRAWEITDTEEKVRNVTLYTGAYLWIAIDTKSSYDLKFRLLFDGRAYRNIEYIRDS